MPREWLGAAGAGRQCAPAALIGRFWAAPQLHSKDFPVVSTADGVQAAFSARKLIWFRERRSDLFALRVQCLMILLFDGAALRADVQAAAGSLARSAQATRAFLAAMAMQAR